MEQLIKFKIGDDEFSVSLGDKIYLQYHTIFENIRKKSTEHQYLWKVLASIKRYVESNEGTYEYNAEALFKNISDVYLTYKNNADKTRLYSNIRPESTALWNVSVNSGMKPDSKINTVKINCQIVGNTSNSLVNEVFELPTSDFIDNETTLMKYLSDILREETRYGGFFERICLYVVDGFRWVFPYDVSLSGVGAIGFVRTNIDKILKDATTDNGNAIDVPFRVLFAIKILTTKNVYAINEIKVSVRLHDIIKNLQETRRDFLMDAIRKQLCNVELYNEKLRNKFDRVSDIFQSIYYMDKTEYDGKKIQNDQIKNISGESLEQLGFKKFEQSNCEQSNNHGIIRVADEIIHMYFFDSDSTYTFHRFIDTVTIN